MTDNPLIILLRGIILAGLSAQNLPNVQVVQSFQPVAQGANIPPTLYFFMIADKEYGWPKKSTVWDPIAGTMTYTQTQLRETTFQLDALVTQNPADITQITAKDLLNVGLTILQDDVTIAQLEAADAAIYRIENVRNPAFVNDKDRFQFAPSFDFTVVYKQTYTRLDNAVTDIVPGIYRV